MKIHFCSLFIYENYLYQYLEVEDGQSPITITAKNGNGSETVTGSMRVAITTQEAAYVKRYK